MPAFAETAGRCMSLKIVDDPEGGASAGLQSR